MRYSGKVAIVTGAGSGIGRGIAEFLAVEGAFLLLNDIHTEAAEASKQLLREKGYRSETAICDISTKDGAEQVVTEAIRHGGRLDLLVNCAARQIIKQVEDLSVEEWDTVLDVNLRGTFLCSKAAIPWLAEQGGSIVNICSVHAQATIEGFASYAASKGGIVALTRAMAIEFAPKGVRVNALSPGTIDTPLLQAYFDSCPNPERARSEFLKFHPIGRFGTPRDIAEMVAFLGSAQAGFITGTEIVVDGGMTALLFRQ
ncbi:MAG: SDR family NAD(P)-dependent oxidoreductase [Acidobacteriaceae bacterium]